MKYVLIALCFALFLSLAPSSASATPISVTLHITAENCEQGMDSCYPINEAYIRAVAGSRTVETSTNSYGKAFLRITVDQVPTVIQVWLNNEVVREVQVPASDPNYSFPVSLQYLPKVVFIPHISREALPFTAAQAEDHSIMLYCYAASLDELYDDRCAWLPQVGL